MERDLAPVLSMFYKYIRYTRYVSLPRIEWNVLRISGCVMLMTNCELCKSKLSLKENFILANQGLLYLFIYYLPIEQLIHQGGRGGGGHQ